jgi:hypothetical protein
VSQFEPTLFLNTPVQGVISNPGSSRILTFNALKDEILSFRLVSNDTLDSLFSIRDSDGNELISNDDYAYPDHRDALLEAITIPRMGTYEVVVRGFGVSTGSFTLTMLPGFANVGLDEQFSSTVNWEASNFTSTDSHGGALSLHVEGIQERGSIINMQQSFSSSYVRLNVQDVSGNNGWGVGLSLRTQSNGDQYIFEVNSQGLWRLIAIEDNIERVIRDWNEHPAIPPGESNFTLGVLLNGPTFEFFYNEQLMGKSVDSELAFFGAVGITTLTPNAISSAMVVNISDLLITVPDEVNGSRIFPEQIINGDVDITVRELERRGVIPSDGQLAFTVPESFVEYTRPGVNRLALGRGAQYRNLAIGATVNLVVNGEGVAGCGLEAQNLDESSYLVAYIDNVGGYSVSRRRGNSFLPGIYGENPLWDATQQNRLLMILKDSVLYYFINGQHVGTLAIESVEGQVGNIVLNFDPVVSSCEFVDTWVWSWD